MHSAEDLNIISLSTEESWGTFSIKAIIKAVHVCVSVRLSICLSFSVCVSVCVHTFVS